MVDSHDDWKFVDCRVFIKRCSQASSLRTVKRQFVKDLPTLLAMEKYDRPVHVWILELETFYLHWRRCDIRMVHSTYLGLLMSFDVGGTNAFCQSRNCSHMIQQI